MCSIFRTPFSRLPLVLFIPFLNILRCHTHQLHRHHQFIRYPLNIHSSQSPPTARQPRMMALCTRPPRQIPRLPSTSSNLISDHKDLCMYHQSRKTISMAHLFHWTRPTKTWSLRNFFILFKCTSLTQEDLLILTETIPGNCRHFSCSYDDVYDWEGIFFFDCMLYEIQHRGWEFAILGGLFRDTSIRRSKSDPGGVF